MIDLKPINKFMTTSAIVQPSPLPRPSKNLWVRKQIFMSGLDTSHRKISNTPKEKFQDQ